MLKFIRTVELFVFVLNSLLCLSGVLASNHCPGMLGNVTKDQTNDGRVIQTNSGNKFLITFLENFRDLESFYTIFVTTRELGRVGFTVTADGIGFEYRGYTQAHQVTPVSVPTELTNLTLTPGSQRMLTVQADPGKTIIVYGLNEQNRTTDAFLALPYVPTSIQPDESFVYIASSHEAIAAAQLYSLIAIVPQITDSETEVTVQFRIGLGQGKAFVYSNSVLNVSDGETVVLRLRNSQTAYVRGYGDLTGTIITSSKPLSVLSGSSCALVPSRVLQCDHLVEQIPPVSTWGTRFVTVPLKERLLYDVFRFIAAFNCTIVSISCVNITSGQVTAHPGFSLDAGGYEERRIPATESCIVKSTNRLLVVQYSVGGTVDGVLADPFMAVLTPADQYSNNYTFAAPTDDVQTYRHFVNLVIPASFYQPDEIFLDGNVLSSATSGDFVELEEDGEAVFYVLQMSIEKGSHTLLHTNPYSQFGLLVYGFGYRNSYGYPGAYSLEKFDIDLYNLNVIHTSDNCIQVRWDTPPDVSPGDLTYSLLLKTADDDHSVVRVVPFTATGATLCDLCSRILYTLTLTSSPAPGTNVSTQAGDVTVKVQTNGLLGLVFSEIKTTTAVGTCSFQPPLNTKSARCRIACTAASRTNTAFVFTTPSLQSDSTSTSVPLKGLAPGSVYSCVAEATGLGCGALETHNVTVQLATLHDPNFGVSGSNLLDSCSIGLGIPFAIVLILLLISLIGNAVLVWYIWSKRLRRVVKVRPLSSESAVTVIKNSDSKHLLVMD